MVGPEDQTAPIDYRRILSEEKPVSARTAAWMALRLSGTLGHVRILLDDEVRAKDPYFQLLDPDHFLVVEVLREGNKSWHVVWMAEDGIWMAPFDYRVKGVWTRLPSYVLEVFYD